MDVQSLIVWLVIGAIAGWLAGQIMTGGGFGLVGNIIVGIIGAAVAGWLFPYLGLSFFGNPLVGAIVNALIGSIIVLFVLGLLKRA
ncbi:MAG TPA: GlsB/YeaQ/YmgE family stress response membrane protein [Hyphomicrobiaceae bacterium]|nr:GlsB/YeaQ/YmgE family stress response membrane protein [Hyphomicrobiaceae bacterium]